MSLVWHDIFIWLEKLNKTSKNRLEKLNKIGENRLEKLNEVYFYVFV
jgi:hypothetical protein